MSVGKRWLTAPARESPTNSGSVSRPASARSEENRLLDPVALMNHWLPGDAEAGRQMPTWYLNSLR